MAEYKSIETERLLLTPASEADAAFFLELMNTPSYLQHIGDRNILSEQDAKDYILLKMLPQLYRLGFSNYTVSRKEDKRKIGSCGLFVRDGFENPDIGFAFLPDFIKKGYAYEAANAVIHSAFDSFGIKTIHAYTTHSNLLSQNLILKLGLKPMGTIQLPNDSTELLNFKVDKIQFICHANPK